MSPGRWARRVYGFGLEIEVSDIVKWAGVFERERGGKRSK